MALLNNWGLNNFAGEYWQFILFTALEVGPFWGDSQGEAIVIRVTPDKVSSGWKYPQGTHTSQRININGNRNLATEWVWEGPASSPNVWHATVTPLPAVKPQKSSRVYMCWMMK